MALIASATVTRVNVTTAGAVLAAAGRREGVYLYNDSVTDCLVKFGASPSATSFTLKLVAGGFYALPPLDDFQGVISAITAAGAADVQVTVLT